MLVVLVKSEVCGCFAADIIAYALVWVFLSDAKCMVGEFLNESCNMIY